jgi:hypothetical protein
MQDIITTRLLVVTECVTTTEYIVIVVLRRQYREDNLQVRLFIAVVVEGGEDID